MVVLTKNMLLCKKRNCREIYMKTKIKAVICVILILTVNWIIYSTYNIIFYYKILVRSTVFCVFYLLQSFLLFYIIKFQSKFIYLFPFYWGIEIWRLFFRIIVDNFSYLNNDIMRFIYRRVTGPLWIASDYVWFLSGSIVCYIHDFPVNILKDYILKLIISIIMFGISIKYALKQYRKS